MNLDTELKKKYGRIYYALAALHLVYLSIFIYSHSGIMIGFNIICFLLYICLGATASKAESLVNHFIICFFEVLINAVLSSTLCGLNCGFSLNIFAILPLIFYSVHMLFDMNHKVALIDCVVLVILYYLTVIFDFTGFGRVYHLGITVERILYIINLNCAFVVMMGFLVVFVSRVNVERQSFSKEKTQLENKANYDKLTKLLNRQSLDMIIEEAIVEARIERKFFSVLMCDIDDFKKVNDTYGHDCGDQVLVSIAGILKNEIRPDDVVFRWGGEEMLILVHANNDIAKNVGERCRKAVEKSSITYNGKEIKVTITIGGCAYYQDASYEDLINRADANLYEGKHKGKNQVVM